MEASATIVSTIHRIIKAISKHIIANNPLSSRSIGIRIEESADGGIVVSGLEVIEAGFDVLK
jgi:hypothetical protein